MRSFAAAKASLVFIKNRCRSSRSQMFFKIGIIKHFAMFTWKHLCWSPFLIKLQAFRCFPVKMANSSFFIEHLRWQLLQMFCLTLYFQKDVAEYIVVLHCIIVSFWNLKSLSFAFIRCITRCHSLYTCCHSFYYSLSLVVIRRTIRCHSLSLLLIRCHSLYHSLSLVFTWCTTRLSFYKRS